MLSEWDWIYEFVDKARKAGDKERVNLWDLHAKAYGMAFTDPDRALFIYEEARRSALLLGEEWWVVFFDVMRVEFILCQKKDDLTALELAIATVLEARKPKYAGLPQRLRLYINLANIYMNIDIKRYAKEIRELIAYLVEENTERYEYRYSLQWLRGHFALVMNEKEEALRQAERFVELCESADKPDEFYMTAAYFLLCRNHRLRKSWDDLLTTAQKCETTALHSGRMGIYVQCFGLQALALLYLGDEVEADRLYRLALYQASRVMSIPDAEYFIIRREYARKKGADLTVIEIYREEIKIRGSSLLPKYECNYRLELCKLLIKMGLPVEEELNAARKAAEKLEKPDEYLTRLAALVKPATE